MQKEDSSSFHSLYPKIKEWFCRIRLFPFQPAKNSGMVFSQTSDSILRSDEGRLGSVERRHLPGRKAESEAVQSSMAMPLRRTVPRPTTLSGLMAEKHRSERLSAAPVVPES